MSQKSFKVGDLVVCINAEDSGEVLEYGRKYEVAGSDNKWPEPFWT